MADSRHVPSPPGRFCRNRGIEWAMAAGMFGVGVVLAIWPNAIEQSRMLFMLDLAPPACWMLLCLAIAWMRAVALFLNGGWPVWGARVRMAAATGSAAVIFQMGLSLLLVQASPPSLSVPVFMALVGAELFSTYRAARDARTR